MTNTKCFTAPMTLFLLVAAVPACTTPNPNYRPRGDASIDTPSGSVCTAGRALRCEEDNSLVRCNGDGTAEVKESCALGCLPGQLRCADVAPSNGLAKFLDLANSQPDFDLGTSATINTDTGEVRVGGALTAVYSETLAQSGAPTIRVLVVRSLATKNVVITGGNALAVVSAGDIQINGTFAASANLWTPGAGAFHDGGCVGEDFGTDGKGNIRGAGGGGFGSPGGSGGSASSATGFHAGGRGGNTTGNESLIPLRGGCAGGGGDGFLTAGGGAIALVSRKQITVGASGKIAANGSACAYSGGGSGGGILLEAPIVSVSGWVVANGGGGDGNGCGQGEDGRLDASPAAGGPACRQNGAGGRGGARDSPAMGGFPISVGAPAGAGSGGGGFGRIRVNTAPGGLRNTGEFSPNASQGTLATR